MKTVVAGALGECVHVAGVLNFLRLAEAAGWRTVFLGPAVSVEELLEAARREKADLVGISYRLTPETGERLLAEFAEEADDLRAAGVRFAFGGTPPVAERARAIGFFERIFDGRSTPRRTDRSRLPSDHRGADRLEGPLSHHPPPLRPAHRGSHPGWDRPHRRGPGAGRRLAGH